MFIKQLRFLLKSQGGRNNQGNITVRAKRKKKRNFYYKLNYYNKIFNITSKIMWVGRRRQQSSFLCLLKTGNSYFNYKTATIFSLKNKEVTTDFDIRALEGNSMPLYSLPLISDISNVEMTKNKGVKLSRSAGTKMRVLRKHSRIGFATIKMPSKKLNYVKWDCLGTVGQNSNEEHFLKNKMKAGTNYHNGRRPLSRGVAMNPVDHPLGGGEGKSSGGRHSCSPWGWLSKGPKTRKKKKKRQLLVLKNKVNKFFD